MSVTAVSLNMRGLPAFAAAIVQVPGVLQGWQVLSPAPLPVSEGFLNVQHKEEKEGCFPHPIVADGPYRHRDMTRLHFAELPLSKLTFTG